MAISSTSSIYHTHINLKSFITHALFVIKKTLLYRAAETRFWLFLRNKLLSNLTATLATQNTKVRKLNRKLKNTQKSSYAWNMTTLKFWRVINLHILKIQSINSLKPNLIYFSGKLKLEKNLNQNLSQCGRDYRNKQFGASWSHSFNYLSGKHLAACKCS